MSGFLDSGKFLDALTSIESQFSGIVIRGFGALMEAEDDDEG